MLTAARPTPAIVKAILANDTVRRSSAACRRCTRCCSPKPSCRRATGCGCASPPAKRCPRRCCSDGATVWGSTSSTASAPPKCCTSSSATGTGDVAPGTTGRAVPGYRGARRRRAWQRHALADAIGDLEVRGDSAAVGYWKLPEQSSATFRDGWVRTGDKYLRRPSGHLVYCGRRDDLLKVGGIYVSPMEVENALLAHPAVIEVAVVGAEDADKLIKPKAIVVARSPSPAARRRVDRARARPARRLQAAALDRVRRCAAEDRDRKDPALQTTVSPGQVASLGQRGIDSIERRLFVGADPLAAYSQETAFLRRFRRRLGNGAYGVLVGLHFGG